MALGVLGHGHVHLHDLLHLLVGDTFLLHDLRHMHHLFLRGSGIRTTLSLFLKE